MDKKEGSELKFWKIFPNQSHAQCFASEETWVMQVPHSSIPDLWGALSSKQLTGQSLKNALRE